MEIRKILFRKEMKLVTLLLTSLMIATASASVYFSLTLKSTVTTAAIPVVKFDTGNDSGSSAANAIISTDGTWVNLAGVKAYPNVTLIYEQAVNITNTSGGDHDIRLSHVSISPSSGWDVANFTSITFKIANTAGSTQRTFTYTVTGTGESSSWSTPSPTSYVTLPATEEWSVRIEIVTKASATAGVDISIDMTLDVKE